MSTQTILLIYLAGYCINVAICLLFEVDYEETLDEIFGKHGYKFLALTASLLWPLLWLHWFYSLIWVRDPEENE